MPYKKTQEVMIDAFIQFGPLGMFLAAFLAGSFLPFSSEAVMLALMAMGVDPWLLIIYGTAGNWVGSVVNYFIGRQGKEEWFEKFLHVKSAQMDKARRFVRGRGAYMAFFAFIPLLGSAIMILLGLMRANITIAFTSMAVGKFLRYIVLIYGVFLVEWIVRLFV